MEILRCGFQGIPATSTGHATQRPHLGSSISRASSEFQKSARRLSLRSTRLREWPCCDPSSGALHVLRLLEYLQRQGLPELVMVAGVGFALASGHVCFELGAQKRQPNARNYLYLSLATLRRSILLCALFNPSFHLHREINKALLLLPAF